MKLIQQPERSDKLAVGVVLSLLIFRALYRTALRRRRRLNQSRTYHDIED